MCELILPSAARKIMEKNKITPQDVLNLQKTLFQQDIISLNEVDTLFALDNAIFRKCEEWDRFFVETLSDFAIKNGTPAGTVDQECANWLITATSRDNRVASPLELELIVRVIEKADAVPASLSAYALRQVADAVIEGEGPLAQGRLIERGVIGADEVKFLSRVLHAFGSGKNVGITKEEAEVLFILNDRSISALNHETWTDLFVKAVTNFMLCASGYEVPARKEALQREAWMDAKDIDLQGFFKRIVDGSISNVLKNYIDTSKIQANYNRRSEERLERDRNLQVANRASARWLTERIGQNGFIQQNEKALINFLRDNAVEVHPEMKAIFEKVA